MAEEMSSSQFQILREDLASMRVEFNQRFDNLVSRDAFRDERARVDNLIQSQGMQIGELRAQMGLEASARVQTQNENLNSLIREKNEREKIRRQTGWQWLFIAITLVAGPVLGALIGSAMTLAGIGP